LVPLVGLTSASILLGERLALLQLAGALLVMIGLAVNVWGGWLFGRLRLARV
jgi:O-acetylserine/cysteine efflux transporter